MSSDSTNANLGTRKYALPKIGKENKPTHTNRHTVPEGTNYFHTVAVGGIRRAPADANRA